MIDEQKGEEMGQVIQIDEARIKDHLGEMVRGTVEEASSGRRHMMGPMSRSGSFYRMKSSLLERIG
jgi:hypothetical protein